MKKLLNLFIFILPIFALSGCGKAEYSFNNIRLSDKTDEEIGITEPKTTFNDNTQTIYGETEFVNPKTDDVSIIQVVWNSLENNGEKSPISSKIIRTKYSGTMLFEANRPGISWPTGDYIIDFIIDENIINSYEFEIVPLSIGTTSEKSTWVENTQTARQVNVNNIPTETTNSFLPADDKIYLTLHTTTLMPRNTEVKVEWHYLTKSRLVNTEVQTAQSNQNLIFTFDKKFNFNFLQSPGNWPLGQYKADLFISGDFISTTTFYVK